MEIIYSSQRHEIILDNNSEWINFTWNVNKEGYARRQKKVDGKRITIFLHRLVISAKPNEIVDHINRNKLDNRLENLRIVDQKLNSINRGKSKNKLSKYKGVTKKKMASKIKYQVYCGGKYIGVYDTEQEAANVYDLKVKETFGDVGVTNKELGIL